MWRDVAIAIGVVVSLHLGLAGILRLYSGRHRLGAYDDAIAVGLVTAAAALLLQVASILWPERKASPTVDSVRGRNGSHHRHRRRSGRHASLPGGRPASEHGRAGLIVGAGDVGTKLVRDMLTDPTSPYLPVAFVDDHPGKQHYRVSGVRVLGDLDAVEQLCRAT